MPRPKPSRHVCSDGTAIWSITLICCWHKSFISDKSADRDFYLLTLMAVARELNTKGIGSANVHLAVGLPLSWVRAQRDSFRQYLMQNERATFRFNGKDYDARFVGGSVFPQGYPGQSLTKKEH